MPSSAPAATRPHSVLAALRDPRLLTVEVLGGLVTAFALIPESLSFAIVAGLDPRMGLYAAFTMACATAVLGGRPAMVSGAAGSIALVIFPVARDHGVDYLIATVILGGLLQLLLGGLGVARLMRFIPRSVMVGFVDALAILIFSAQLPQLIGVPWLVYPLVAAGVVVIVLFPRLTRRIPGPLVTILLITLAVVSLGADVPTVGDQGELPHSLPVPGLPHVPIAWHTLQVIAPYAIAMALVGLMESLLTATLVDDLTRTRGSCTREALGQGAANVITGIFGGMGGCAMIGQTIVNVKQAGARTRLSAFLAGVFLITLSVALGDTVGRIPMAALVAVMLVVAATTFDWHSLRSLGVMPRSETLVLLTTVLATVFTRNLAVGVILGVVVAALAFTRRIAHMTQVVQDPDHPGLYRVRGQLFFASSNDLVEQFDYAGGPEHVTVDLSGATVWDASTVAALDGVREQYRRAGRTVEFTGLDRISEHYVERLAGRLG
ncbi:sodium-independent anion transporter [Brachybacterium endophyticum]|uniref:Sodium-independent anion transporter n=1 Tax=Brachybacterium endophyticum TaxID=2182385 RepID=A0A2U2RHA9_9MICO|nr:SulP family inorganic anion transporter [Brachybacterium endophyticum]PWH05238.1 sodium-independent anion transporter [Brachybacterium endophyticum]